MQRSEGRARQTERQWDAQIKTAQSRRGRDSKTSVICNPLMFNGCSWIKNFQLLSARWKRGREGGREGWRRRRRRLRAAYLRLCINPAFGNRRDKPTTSKNPSGGAACCHLFSTYFFFLFVCPDACLHFARTAWIWIVGS